VIVSAGKGRSPQGRHNELIAGGELDPLDLHHERDDAGEDDNRHAVEPGAFDGDRQRGCGDSRFHGRARGIELYIRSVLIDIVRIESGDLGMSLEPVLVRTVIEESCQLMAPIAAKRSIPIIRDRAYRSLAVYADRQRLAQILVNLISNAVKYNDRIGSITISCGEQGTGQVSIVVTDTGPGLAPEDLERIFIPFERLGAERTEIEGTGIGLPLARALTEAMKGQLTAASVLGQGAAFTVSLPRAPDLIPVPAPSPAPASVPAGPRPPAGTGISILCIEDNPANQR
jgi:signal transduction histidine kinase